MRLALLAALPWLGALGLALLPAAGRRSLALTAGLAGAAAALACALAVSLAPEVLAGGVPRQSIQWLPALGLDLGLRLDGLAWLFALLVTGIGTLVLLYAAWYLDPAEPAWRFFACLLLFMGAMLLVVLADNLLLLALAWELTGLASFLLISWWHRDDDAREGARMALTVTGAGGLALLAGLLLLGHIAGGWSLDHVLASGERIRAHPLYETALALVLLGAFTKSAQFPFHFWLPHAMAAPTPVSAYLHSATLVKAGVFLLARLYPALAGSQAWFWSVTLVGLATLIVGAWIAIFRHDLKSLLAYSTISHLGLVTLLLGLGEPLAVVAAVFHVVNHAIFKAGLFMSVGIIDHECGTRDLRRINGLMRYMPFTATLGMVAAAAMAGVPLLNGFLSKEMFFAETLGLQGRGALQWLLPAGATLAGVFAVAYSLRFIHDTFFNGEPRDLPRQPHEPPFFMRLPVLLLVLLCLALGLAPQALIGGVLDVAAQAAVHGRPGTALPPYQLALWHGLNLPLAMSLTAVAGGIALYFGLQSRVDLHRIAHLPGGFSRGGREAFRFLLDALLAAGGTGTRLLQNGSLQRYLALLLVTALAAGLSPWLAGLPWRELPAGLAAAAPASSVGGVELALAGLGMASAAGALVLHRQRLVAVLLVGGVGLAVSLLFAWFSAPDLALTQLLVEFASVLLVVLSLRWLPAEAPPPGRLRAWRDGALAAALGAGVAALLWQVLTLPTRSISGAMLADSLPLGGGANAVNVIIVDFRGLDTFGEITVLAIAALTVHGLLAGFVPHGPRPPAAPAALPLQVVVRWLWPFVVLLAVHLFLRGHNLPGGGFIAGLVLALGLLLRALAERRASPSLRPPAAAPQAARPWLGLGLLVAASTGLGSLAFGSPFLTSTYDYPWWPLVGAVPLASASLFDLGVLVVVVAATWLMLGSLLRLAEP
jgi:multicomponent K+:H+ antiporter subunit A